MKLFQPTGLRLSLNQPSKIYAYFEAEPSIPYTFLPILPTKLSFVAGVPPLVLNMILTSFGLYTYFIVTLVSPIIPSTFPKSALVLSLLDINTLPDTSTLSSSYPSGIVLGVAIVKLFPTAYCSVARVITELANGIPTSFTNE